MQLAPAASYISLQNLVGGMSKAYDIRIKNLAQLEKNLEEASQRLNDTDGQIRVVDALDNVQTAIRYVSKVVDDEDESDARRINDILIFAKEERMAIVKYSDNALTENLKVLNKNASSMYALNQDMKSMAQRVLSGAKSM